jgi:exonuclease V gamma subunit
VGEDFILSGAVSGVFGQVRLVSGFGKQTARRMLSLWIEHLALCVELADFRGSLLVSRAEGDAEVAAVGLKAIGAAKAKKILGELICLNYLGQVFPLPFFPEASFLCASRTEKELEKQSGDAFLSGLSYADKNWSKRPDSVLQLYRDLNPLISGQPEECAASQQPFCRLALHISRGISELVVDTRELLAAQLLSSEVQA